MTEKPKCQAHRHWSQTEVEIHHIMPKAEGGPDIADNKIPICPNAHTEVHLYLRLLKKHAGMVPWLKRRSYGRGVRRIAEEGYRRITLGYTLATASQGIADARAGLDSVKQSIANAREAITGLSVARNDTGEPEHVIPHEPEQQAERPEPGEL